MKMNEIKTDRIFIDLKILILIISNFTINTHSRQNQIIGCILLSLIFVKIFFKNQNRQLRIIALFYHSSQILISGLFASLQFEGKNLSIQLYTLGLITQSSFNLCKDLDLNSSTALTKFRYKFITCLLQIIAIYFISMYLMSELISIDEFLNFSLINFLNILECLYDYKQAMFQMTQQTTLRADEYLQQQQNSVIKHNEMRVLIEKSLDSNRIRQVQEEEQSQLIIPQMKVESKQGIFSFMSENHRRMEQKNENMSQNIFNRNPASTVFNPNRNMKSRVSRASINKNNNVIHKDLLEMFPEGIIILNSRMRYVFMNQSLQKQFNQANKEDTLDEFMGLRNTRKSLQKQGKTNGLQLLLDKRIDQSYFSNSNEDNENEKIDFQDNSSLHFDENVTVEEILKTLMSLNSIRVPINDNLYQIFELVEIICEYSGSESQQINNIPSQINNPSISIDLDVIKSKKFLFQIRFLPYFSRGQLYILCQVRDITMFNVVKVLKAMNQTKQKMLSFVAHEFRTPLNCIILMLMATMDKDASRDQIDLKLIQTSLVQAENLLILVNDLLDASQIQAAKFKINMVVIDFFELLSDIHNLLNIQAQNLEIDLQLNIQENIPRFIMSDPIRIRQVIINLAGNAIKFTPKKGKISILIQSDVLKEIIITIIDNGSGINPENQGKLFKAFAKLDDPMNQNLQGVGLGLVISNILAQKLSVNVKNLDSSPVGIQVFSQGEGHGSQFQFTIFNQSEEIASSQIEYISSEMVRNMKKEKNTSKKNPEIMQIKNMKNSQHLHECQCPQILIVDDNQFNINAQKILLNKQNLIIDEAICGTDAIKKVQGYPKCLNQCNNYTIILLDLEMPDINGFQTSQQLIQYCDENQIHCYIIGFSGHSSDMQKKACLMAGMIDLIQKPAKSKLIMEYFVQISQLISQRKQIMPNQTSQELDKEKANQMKTEINIIHEII